jgi:hypothetical protein
VDGFLPAKSAWCIAPEPMMLYPILDIAKACCEMSRRDGAIVAWHEVPG